MSHYTNDSDFDWTAADAREEAAADFAADVEAHKHCPHCNGRGGWECDECGGEGRILVEDFGDGVKCWRDCYTCDCTGRIECTADPVQDAADERERREFERDHSVRRLG